MPIIPVPDQAQARAIHVRQILLWMQGSQEYSAPVSFTGWSGSSLVATYALTVRNREAIEGRGLRVEDSGGTMALFSVAHAGVEIRPLPAGSLSAFRVRNLANDANIFEVTTTGVIVRGTIGVIDTGGVSRTLVDTSTTATLTNKTLNGAVLSLPYINDGAMFNINQAAPAAAGANRSIIYGKAGSNLLHMKIGASETEYTMVDTDSPQTLNNKTIAVTTLNAVTNQSQFINNYADWAIVNNPGTPVANRARMFMNVDNNVYYVLPDGSTRRLATVEPVTTQESFARSLMFMGA